jgi:hypothetical protein
VRSPSGAWLRLVGLGLAVAFAGLASVVDSADAHEGEAVPQGFVSTVSGIRPNVVGVSALVLDGDDRLLLRNLSGRVIMIRGYEGEPYLRLTPTGVFANIRSPATYLNRDRLPRRSPPKHANPAARPQWRRVSTGVTYQWHDHRIHWMRSELPPAVAAAPDRTHHVFDWRVPGTVNGRPFAVTGFLGYAPPVEEPVPESDDGDQPWIVPLAVAGGALAVGALFLRMRAGPR